MGSTGNIFSINVSRGGVPKTPIAEAEVGPRGITVDRQADLRNHGSPEQALCLYAVEVIETLRAEGHPIFPGSTGENITTEGIDWRKVVPGASLRLGAEVLVEITDYATPCNKNAPWFREGDFNRMNHKTQPGFSRIYARVIQGGQIRAGDPIELLEVSAAERLAARQPYTLRWPRDFQ